MNLYKLSIDIGFTDEFKIDKFFIADEISCLARAYPNAHSITLVQQNIRVKNELNTVALYKVNSENQPLYVAGLNIYEAAKLHPTTNSIKLVDAKIDICK